LDGIPKSKIVWGHSKRFVYKGTKNEFRVDKMAQKCAGDVLHRRQLSIHSEVGKTLLDGIKKESEGGVVIPRLVVQLTTACTLRCKHCNNLIPMLEKRHVSLDRVLSNIRKVVDSVDRIIILELIGGEPFLYPDLERVLDEVAKYEKIMEVEVTTNGTIVPKEAVIQKLKNGKVYVKISNYAASSRISELESTFFYNNVRNKVFNNLEWIDSGGIEKRNKGIDELRDNFCNCYPSYLCKTLFDGKIYQCARSASLYDLGVIASPKGYIDIDTCSDLGGAIKEFWLRCEDEACDYCEATDESRKIPPAEQM
jgi:organic radical activating enzyme